MTAYFDLLLSINYYLVYEVLDYCLLFVLLVLHRGEGQSFPT